MTAGSVTTRLTMDASGFKSEVTEATSLGQREYAKFQRAVQFANDYVKDMAKAQKAANDAGAGIAENARSMERFGFHTQGAQRSLMRLAADLARGDFEKAEHVLPRLVAQTGLLSEGFALAGGALIGGSLAVGLFAAAAALGARESNELAKSLALTNNAAGLTSTTFDQIAQRVASSSGGTLGATREALQQIASTGRISQGVVEDVTRATVLMEKATGASAEEAVKDFVKMTDGVAKWAQEHNRQYHYLTAAQFAYIKQLEDQGKAEEAQRENVRLLNEQMAKVQTNLGYLGQAWKWVSERASEAWEAMKGAGKAETTADQIAKVQKLLEQYQGQQGMGLGAKAVQDMRAAAIDKLKQEMYLLQEKAKLEKKAADQQSAYAAAQQIQIDKLMAKPGKAGKADKQDPLSAIRDPRDQYRHDFLMTEIASYEELAKAEAKAADAAEKLAKEQDKSFSEWFQKFNEKELAANAPREDAVNTAIGRYLRDIGDQTKNAEQLVNGAFGRMEDAIVEFTHTGKLSFTDLFSFMADEYIRNAVRMAQKSLFTDSAGNFIGMSSIFKGLGSVGSAIGGFLGFGHAQGLDYVPYDGYPAILHKGERVQTAVQARSSPGSQSSHTEINVAAGMNRSEVLTAIQLAVRASESRLTNRFLRQDGAH